MADSSILTVRVGDQEQTISAEGRRTQLALSALLRQAGVSLNTRCGQRGLCDGCLVDLLSGPLIDAATGVALEASSETHGIRACQYHLPPDGHVEIHVPSRSLLAHEPQVVTSFRINVSRAHDPLWQRIEVPTGERTPGKPPAEAICEAVARQRDYDLPVQAAADIAPLPPPEQQVWTLALEQAGDHWLVKPGDAACQAAPFGIAVDVGTTTVVAVLVDLTNGEIVNTA